MSWASDVRLTGAFNEFQPTRLCILRRFQVRSPQIKCRVWHTICRSHRCNLLELCRLKNTSCKHVAFMSSSTVYGDFEGIQSMKPCARAPWRLCQRKYIGERMVREAKELYGIDYTIVRLSALYGIRCVSGRVTRNLLKMRLWTFPCCSRAVAVGVWISPTSVVSSRIVRSLRAGGRPFAHLQHHIWQRTHYR